MEQVSKTPVGPLPIDPGWRRIAGLGSFFCPVRPLLAAGRLLARRQAQPGREVASALEGPPVAARRHDRRGRLRAAAGHLQQPPARRPFRVVLPDPPLQLLPCVPPFRDQVAPPRRQPVLRFL